MKRAILGSVTAIDNVIGGGEDDITGNDLPNDHAPPNWRNYSFSVNSQSTTIPAGWVLTRGDGANPTNADWVSLMQRVDSPRFGTLPDFGNWPPESDKYEGVRKLMRWAKAVSAKCYDFDADGNETTIDFPRMMQIVRDAGYDGYVGIEYEGTRLSEREGIAACKRLLERCHNRCDFSGGDVGIAHSTASAVCAVGCQSIGTWPG